MEDPGVGGGGFTATVLTGHSGVANSQAVGSAGMNSNNTFSVTITVTDRASLERQLDSAIAAALPNALSSKRHGILVTRHSVEKFTVAFSELVPYGETMERSDW